VKALRVIYSGDVQGVFFRAGALEISARFDVAGYVKNISDGRVELVVEGEDEEVSTFLAEVKKSKESNITDIEVIEEKPEGFAEFSIRN